MSRQRTRELDGSLGDFMQSVRKAFEVQFPPVKQPGKDYPHQPFWIRDIYEDSVVVRDDDDNQLYRVAMTVDEEGGISFAPIREWEKVKLTYAREMVSETHVTELQGAFPKDIPVREGVDLAALTEGDDDPFFLTLEISSEGRVSSNGLLHDADLAQTLVAQIMSSGAEGVMGHIREEDRATAFPVSDIHWIGAVREGKKTWAKGYIPKTATAQREHFRILKATNGKAATSVYGFALREYVDKKKGTWRAKDFELEQLDLAPYKRAALPPESGFLITKEVGEHQEKYVKETEMNKEHLIREMTAEDAALLPDAVKQAILAASTDARTLAEVRKALGADESADLVKVVTELKAAEESRKKEAVTRRIKELVCDAETGVKLESARPIVTELVTARQPSTPEEAEAAYKAVVEMESVKALLSDKVLETMGPPLRMGVQGQNGKSRYFDIPEEKEEA